MLSIYKASAGSGKTFALTREYIRMLLRDSHTDMRLPHSRILAVTFTKKSTAEMKERILKELYTLAQFPEQSAYLQDFLQDKHIGLTKESIQERAQLLIIGILQDYNRFSISTIDGFFQQVIRTFALELGLSTNYDLSLDQQEIIEQAVDDIFKSIRSIHKSKDTNDLNSWLIEYTQNNIEQDKYWNPIENIKKFSGELSKERLIQQLEDIQEIFSDKEKMRSYYNELKEIKDKIHAQVTELQEQIKQKISTFNIENLNKNAISICNKPVEELLSKGLNTTLVNVLDGTATFYKKTGVSKGEQQVIQNRFENELYPVIDKLQKLLTSSSIYDYITANAILKKIYSLGILQDVALQIKTTNQQQGRLPISEINQLIYKVIDGQEAPFIYERIGQYYHHYMIDEFQDTSILQWKNFSPLITESESNGFNNLIVGDIKQSIYRFRNSDWHLLTQVDKEFDNTEFAKGMDGNWRTAKEIVENNEQLMQQYCTWVVEDLKVQYPNHTTQLDELAKIYSYDEMHQQAKKKSKGYFHMQFFEGKNYIEQSLDTLVRQIQEFQQENIDLSRITILTRTSNEAELVAKQLILHSFEVQSAQGLRIESHQAVQILIALLKLSITPNEIHTIFLTKLLGDIEQYRIGIEEAKTLPLYSHVQKLIDVLNLTTWDGALPYITAFQDKIYQFTQNKVADIQLFLKYWDTKGKDSTIAATTTSNAINIMTIHSSKGLEFDIVMIPFFDWKLKKTHNDDIIWCTPSTAPFNLLPLVPVYPSSDLVRSHLAEDYIQEQFALYTDILNLTYVAITRPKYRLYIYGPMFTMKKKDEPSKPNNIGQLISLLYHNKLNTYGIYTSLNDDESIPILPIQEDKENNNDILSSKYTSIPIGDQRLKLRNHSNDEFELETPISTIDLGNSMHLWLSHIKIWEDATPTLERLLRCGLVTAEQEKEMKNQLQVLKEIITQHNHNDWFSNNYQILTEQEILTPSQKTYRPDRIMLKDKHAIVVDYKFGYQQKPSYIEQMRGYILLLRQLGYTSEGYIIYNQTNKIQKID